jgi:pimeloyl-ACP methyl ester carboxylesterase
MRKDTVMRRLAATSSQKTEGHEFGGAADNASGSLAGGRVPIIALHCSGSDGSQWRKLAAAIGSDYELHAPSFIGSGATPHWHGERAFTLLDEARPIIDMVDGIDAAVHLVGHSYGGGVALKVASLRPGRIASLSLYEPSPFHLLRELGAENELAEINGVLAAVLFGLGTGAYAEAAATFVDYWSGPGAWGTLRPEVHGLLIRWLPKAALEFRAVLDDHTPLAAYQQLPCPILVMRGERALAPSRCLAEALAQHAARADLDVLPCAGHMGPLTHARQVIDRVIAHVRAAQSTCGPSGRTGSLAA